MLDFGNVIYNLALSLICGSAITGLAFLITSEKSPDFPKLLRNKRRGFLVGTLVAFVGITLFPFLRDIVNRLIS